MRVLFVVVAVGLLLTSAPSAQNRSGGYGAGGGLAAPTNNAIVGHVRVPGGAPAVGAFITALRPVASDIRPYSPINIQLHALTDTTGFYRLDGLAPGEYFVLAIPKNESGTPAHSVRSGFGCTFFPDTTDLARADRVVVNGQKPATADVVLAGAPLALVSGTVLGSGNSPVPDARFEVAHGDHIFGLDSHGYRASSTGRFVLPPMPPGTYFLVFHESAWPPPRGTVPTISQTKITVTGTDLPGVFIKPIHAVHASGHIVMDAVTRGSIDPTTLVMSAPPVDSDGNPGPAQPNPVQRDLSFSVGGWPGRNRISVHDATGVWTVKSIRRNGAEIGRDAIDFEEGHDLSELEVELIKPPARGRGGS